MLFRAVCVYTFLRDRLWTEFLLFIFVCPLTFIFSFREMIAAINCLYSKDFSRGLLSKICPMLGFDLQDLLESVDAEDASSRNGKSDGSEERQIPTYISAVDDGVCAWAIWAFLKGEWQECMVNKKFSSLFFSDKEYKEAISREQILCSYIYPYIVHEDDRDDFICGLADFYFSSAHGQLTQYEMVAKVTRMNHLFPCLMVKK